MKKRAIHKLSVSRETLGRLEDRRLEPVAGGTVESICWCITHICITLKYSNCDTCNCS
jgi:hypothetical protein